MTDSKIFLDNAAWGMPPTEVLNCASTFVNMFKDPSLTTRDITLTMRSWMVGARNAVSRLIHCDSKEIALVESTNHALGLIANALPIKDGDNILICDLEYQASTICWKRRQEDIDFELREVKTHKGEVKAEDFEKSMDSHTVAIVIASVQEINGYRADIKSIAALARRHNCFSIVDGIQEVGALQVDVKDLNVDIYCAGGKKWIGNPFGMGFIYIRNELLPLLKPYAYGCYNAKVPPKYDVYTSYLEDPLRHPFDNCEIVTDATKFENGGFANYLGALGLKTAIEVLFKIGPQQIEDKILMLNQKLTNGLSQLGIQTCSSKDPAHMSSIISFNFGLKDASTEKERALIKFLREKHIFVSLRCCTGTGGIRVSFHYYTPEEHIDIFLNVVSAFLKNH